MVDFEMVAGAERALAENLFAAVGAVALMGNYAVGQVLPGDLMAYYAYVVVDLVFAFVAHGSVAYYYCYWNFHSNHPIHPSHR